MTKRGRSAQTPPPSPRLDNRLAVRFTAKRRSRDLRAMGQAMFRDPQLRDTAPQAQPAATPAPAPAAAPDLSGVAGYAAQKQATQPPGTGYAAQKAALAPAGLGKATVTTAALNVRAQPSVAGARLGVAHQGDVLPVAQDADGWLGVRFLDGIGFVAKPYVKVVADAAAAPVAAQAPKTAAEPPPPALADPAASQPALTALLAKPRLTPDEVKAARALVAKEPHERQGDLFEALQSKGEYHSQRDNQSTTEGANQDNMCNLTSLAMCLENIGIKNPGSLDGKPYAQFEDYLEALRIKNKYGDRTTGAALESLAKAAGAQNYKYVFADKMTTHADWIKWRDAYLRTGYAFLMSIGGHIVRVQGVTDSGLIVDDPYGVVTLKPGTDPSHHWSYDAANRNKKGAADNKGEDNVWRWDDVEKHQMHWLVAIR